MYRYILVHSKDRKYQLILKYESPKHPVRLYELNTITYGTGLTLFIAMKCLVILAEEIALNNPDVSNLILNFYRDGFLGGADYVSTASEFRRSVHENLLQAGFLLR